jgi:uncharacterized protein
MAHSVCRMGIHQGLSRAALLIAAALLVPHAQAQTSSASSASALRQLKWSDLVPVGWDPAQEVRKRSKDQNFSNISDSDPRMLEMLKQLREVWDSAPVNPAMEGVQGRIPGYVVPLEEDKQGLREMLLVPYYGACIHSPPPPANQIIHVVLSQPAKGFSMMNTVWVTGKFKVFRGTSYMGASGYKIDDAALTPYVNEPPKPAK